MAALRQVFDTNQNGWLDGADARWSEFRIWQDGNSDGVSQAPEMHPLADLGVGAIDLNPTGPAKSFPDGSVISGSSLYLKTDGSTGLAGDVALAYELAGSQGMATAAVVSRGLGPYEFLLH